MLENQIIGIAAVFLLTFCLIALYHLIGKIGPRRKRYNLLKEKANEGVQNQPHDSKKSSGKDDAWLLWSPDLEERADAPKPGLGERRRNHPLG